jgi:hypothetical protein
VTDIDISTGFPSEEAFAGNLYKDILWYGNINDLYLLDVNFDGIPELLVSSELLAGAGGSNITVITMKDDAAIITGKMFSSPSIFVEQSVIWQFTSYDNGAVKFGTIGREGAQTTATYTLSFIDENATPVIDNVVEYNEEHWMSPNEPDEDMLQSLSYTYEINQNLALHSLGRGINRAYDGDNAVAYSEEEIETFLNSYRLPAEQIMSTTDHNSELAQQLLGK